MTRRVDSNTALTMFSLWLASLTLLAWPHFISSPNLDTWLPILRRPIALIIVPLLVACIPLITSGKQSGGERVEDESSGDSPKRIKSNTVRKMVSMWAIALVVFAAPHPLRGHVLDPIVHRAVFLIFAPLLIAFIPLIIQTKETTLITSPVFVGKSRARQWGEFVLQLVTGTFVLMALIALNDPQTLHKEGDNLGLNIFFTFILVIILFGIWQSIKVLKNSN